MASLAMKLSIFLLLSLFSSLHTHARDSQFFNKIPSTTTTTNTNTNTNTNNNEVPTTEQDPSFLPQNENSYGLYGHESGQNPPSTATTAQEFKQPPNKYLPKNYNPVAYVTQPESDVNQGTEERTYTTNTKTSTNNDNEEERNNYYSGEENYYNNNQQLEESEFRRYPTTANNGVANMYYGGGSSFNSPVQGQRGNTFQPQGMSDTRYMENGKYFYDTNSQKYSSNHPYETLRGQSQNQFNNRNFYGNNAYEFNGDNSYQNANREDFQDDENMP